MKRSICELRITYECHRNKLTDFVAYDNNIQLNGGKHLESQQ